MAKSQWAANILTPSPTRKKEKKRHGTIKMVETQVRNELKMGT